MAEQTERSQWGSRFGFIMAAMGSAVGLGNIWRYPYIVYDNGGGTFLIPYFIAVFVVGIPVMMLEFGLGHHMRQAFPGALRKISPRFSWIGWWSVSFVMFGIVVYYAVVIAWCVLYFLLALGRGWIIDGWGDKPTDFFNTSFLLKTEAPYDSGEGFVMGDFVVWVFVALAFIWFVNWTICYFEIKRGLERATKIFMPLLVFLMLVLVVWSWGLDGAEKGREFYLLKPDWNALIEAKVWVAAFTQVFFSLSLGFGIMVAYASYLPAKPNIPASAFLTCVGNCLFSFVGGFAIFNTIGMMAEAQTVDVANVMDAGPGLCFEVYPKALNIFAERAGTVLGFIPAGHLFSSIFFLVLVVAGLTSSVSIVEAFSSSITDYFRVKRGHVVTVLCGAAFVLGILFCFGSGVHWLGIVDSFLNAYGLLLVVILETIIVGWYFTPRRLRAHLAVTHDMRMVGWVGIAMKVMITLLLGFTWYGLASAELGMAARAARFVALLGIFLVWLDEHWLDFDIKYVIPMILILLLDLQLGADITTGRDYSWQALVGIGVSWTVGTLVVAITLDRVVAWRLSRRSR
jgi:NSS family neurotransmitter:Na+ symporter